MVPEKGFLIVMEDLLMSKFDQIKAEEIPVYTVATLPAVPAITERGYLIQVSDAVNGGSGTGVLAFSDGTNWLSCITGSTVA